MDIIVGTAGHIDHGKTALVRALTGVDADRLPEEKRRGITVDLGFAEMNVGDIHCGFVDVPGHERFVKNMLAGASGIDLVLFVVAADEGVMPQTREHFDICRLLGVRSGLIALTKSDLVDDEMLELARLDIAELVAGSFLDDRPVIAVSSKTGTGVDEVKSAILSVAPHTDTYQNTARDLYITRLPIDRSFSMRGFGTVVTGTLASGDIRAGSEVDLMPEGRRVRIRGLQTHGRTVDTARHGQRVAVNLAGVDHHEVERGMTLTEPDALTQTQAIDLYVEVLPTSPRPLRSRQRVRLHLGTAEVLARVRVLTGVEIAAGSKGIVQLRLESPIAAVTGERFILRSYSPQMTIAGGEVIDPLAPRHRSRTISSVVEWLERFRDASPRDKVLALIAAVGRTGSTMSELQARTGYTGEVIGHALAAARENSSITEAHGRYIDSSVFGELGRDILTALANFHGREPLAAGMPIDELRAGVFAFVPEQIMKAGMVAMTQAGKIVVDKDLVRLSTHRTELSTKEKAFIDHLSRRLATGLEVPKLSEAVAEACQAAGVLAADAQKLLRLQFTTGKLIKVSEDFAFSRVVIDALVAKLKDHADRSPDRSIDMTFFKELTGVSRKYAIPLLEYFDRQKVTARVGDRRVIL